MTIIVCFQKLVSVTFLALLAVQVATWGHLVYCRFKGPVFNGYLAAFGYFVLEATITIFYLTCVILEPLSESAWTLYQASSDKIVNHAQKLTLLMILASVVMEVIKIILSPFQGSETSQRHQKGSKVTPNSSKRSKLTKKVERDQNPEKPLKGEKNKKIPKFQDRFGDKEGESGPGKGDSAPSIASSRFMPLSEGSRLLLSTTERGRSTARFTKDKTSSESVNILIKRKNLKKRAPMAQQGRLIRNHRRFPKSGSLSTAMSIGSRMSTISKRLSQNQPFFNKK